MNFQFTLTVYSFMMSDFSTWWEGLSLSLKIYWVFAVPFTLFFLLQLVWSFFGGGDVPDDTPDAEVNADSGVAFQFFTLKNLIAFFTIFGWTGISCLTAGLSEVMTIIASVAAGLAMMAIMASVFYFMSKADADGTMRIQKAIGVLGEVYLTIQRKRGAIGKVQVKVQGALRTLDAVTDDETDIPTGKMIEVTGIINDNVLLVTLK